MKRLRMAVIGAGHLGRIHARLLSSLDQVQLVGIVDPAAQCRQQVAGELGIATFAHYQQLLGQIDAAVIATPTQSHHAVGMEMLERGVHLLIEKPIATTRNQADDLVQAARKQGRVLQVGHVERFNPAWTAVQSQLARPRYIDAVRAGRHTFRSMDIGVVLDLMIHDLDLVLSLVQSPIVQVDAVGMTLVGPQEDVAQARLVFENGCVANLNASRLSCEPQRKMQLFSDQLAASIDFATSAASIVRPSAQLQQGEFQPDRLSAAEKQHLHNQLFVELLPTEHVQVEPRNAIQDEQREFVSSVLTASPIRVTGDQARDALAVAERILDRMTLHHWTGQAAAATASPLPAILPGPHVLPSSAVADSPQRKAG